ncbi:hypothetical protein C8R46DRAFT_1198283 [Mycena filopes]|nr:hypothetical protein C8R46DRAFT_1198283 [Mycena filopes]
MPLSRIFRSAAPVDWLSPLIIVSKGLVSVADCVPFPYVGSALRAGLALLELIQTVGKSDEDLKYLAESVVTIMSLLKEELDSHGSLENPRLRQVCLEFESDLTRLSKDLEAMSKNWSSSKFRKYLNSQNVRDDITQLKRQLDDLRANATLIAATGTRMDVADGFATVESRISELHREIKQSTVSPVPTPSFELARYEEDFHALKPGDIHLHFHTSRAASFVRYDLGHEKSCTAWTDYRATVKGSVHTVRVYQGSEPTESWKGFLSFLADNSPSPHLPQLFGFCSSPRLRCLVFHGEFCTLDEYARTLPTPEAIVRWELSLLGAIRRLCASNHYWFDYALASVDPQDRGTMVVSHMNLPDLERGSFARHSYPPFLEWVVHTAYSPPEVPLMTECGSDGGVRDLLQSLIPLYRGHTFGSPLHSLHSSLTARGSVYNKYTGRTVSQIFPRVVVPEDIWHVYRVRFDTCSRPEHHWPTRSDETRNGFTHFELPLHAEEDEWRSPHDLGVHTGYFLSAIIDFGVSVPDVFDTWLAQASSVMAHPALQGCKVTDFVVPQDTRLELFWEMVVVRNDSSILAELPDTIHVFIQPPVLSDGEVEEPEIFWSTDADTIETNVPPAALKIRTNWNLYLSGASWEAHHYEVAEKLQEEAGFDPKTTAAAESLGLPILKTRLDESLIAADENEPPKYPDWYRYSERDPHTMEEFLGCRPRLNLEALLLN